MTTLKIKFFSNVFFQKFLNCLGRGKVITSHLGYRKQSALQQLSCFCFSNSQHLRNFFYAVLPEIVILAEIQLFFCYYKNHLRGYYCVKEPHTFPHRFLRPSRPRKGCTVYIQSQGTKFVSYPKRSGYPQVSGEPIFMWVYAIKLPRNNYIAVSDPAEEAI